MKPRNDALLLLALLAASTGSWAEETPSNPSAAGAEIETPAGIIGAQDARTVFQTVCAACHGPNGEGKREVMAPSIAGVPTWYSTLQLEKFRAGERGKPHQDVAGTQMRAIALALTPELVPKMAEYIASLDPIPTSIPEAVDFEYGESIYMGTCAQCHRYNGQGERVFRSAPLTHLPAWYIEESLRKFREGLRGYQHSDLDGPKMREIAQYLGDKEIEQLIAYISHLAEKYPPGETRRGPREAP